MRFIPSPNYDYRTDKLKRAYQSAILAILRELERMDVANLTQANARAHLADIAKILAGLDKESAQWVSDNIPLAARDGVAKTLVELGVVASLDEARGVVKFNRANKALIDAAIADTQSDLLAVTQNVDRKVKSAVRRVTSEVMRSNYAGGTVGRKTITKEILEGLRKELGKSVETGIIDKIGRRWDPSVYANMLVRTKMQQTHIEATRNEAVQRGALYGIISSHGATDSCRFHEGRIIKLDPSAPGDYPTYEQLQATGQVFHVNCRHVVTALKRIDRLPSDVLDKADKQDEAGRKAIATGKRNPTNDELNN